MSTVIPSPAIVYRVVCKWCGKAENVDGTALDSMSRLQGGEFPAVDGWYLLGLPGGATDAADDYAVCSLDCWLHLKEMIQAALLQEEARA